MLGCDVIELQEARRLGRTEFAAAGYKVFSSGEDWSSGQARQHGVGLAVKGFIVREATGTHELMNERLMSMTFNLVDTSNAMARQILCPIRGNRRMRVGRILIALLVECPAATICFFTDTNTRTGVQIGEKDCEVTGAYGRDTLVSDSNGTLLLWIAGDNKLALVNTFFSVSKGCTSRTSNGTRPAERKRTDYIIKRQPHRKLVRNITVHLQPRTYSDHDIVCATVRLPGRFARDRKQRAPTGRKSMDRRAITSDTD